MENQSPVVPPAIKCPACGSDTVPNASFCYNCGKPIKEKPVSIGKEILIYLVSFFLSPLGLYFTVRHAKIPGKTSRRIVIISIILTVAALVVAAYSATIFLRSAYQTINMLNAGLY